jgi:hypothetical protein
VTVKKQRIEHQWKLTGSLCPRPSLENDVLVGLPSPPYDGLVSSVGIASAGGGWWWGDKELKVPRNSNF